MPRRMYNFSLIYLIVLPFWAKSQSEANQAGQIEYKRNFWDTKFYVDNKKTSRKSVAAILNKDLASKKFVSRSANLRTTGWIITGAGAATGAVTIIHMLGDATAKVLTNSTSNGSNKILPLSLTSTILTATGFLFLRSGNRQFRNGIQRFNSNQVRVTAGLGVTQSGGIGIYINF